MQRSKAYRTVTAQVDRTRLYTPAEAIKLAQQTSPTKFDATVEVAMRLGVDPRKADQMVRGTVNLPHGTGKTARVIVFAAGEKAAEAQAAGADEVGSDELVARIQGGWLDFDAATQTFGLVTPGGIVGSTGVVGLSLGGGIGHLTAQYGLTCDHISGAEVVTPDGTVIQVSADENADLLWGLRGGGGNFGVATRLEFRLHSLERVVGGRLVYRGSGVREALLRYRDVVARSPRDLSCQVELSLDESLAPTLLIAPSFTRARLAAAASCTTWAYSSEITAPASMLTIPDRSPALAGIAPRPPALFMLSSTPARPA